MHTCAYYINHSGMVGIDRALAAYHPNHHRPRRTACMHRAARNEGEGALLPVLLCGDFNARPPPLEGEEAAAAAAAEYPPEAIPIVLRAPAGFRSCYNLDECVDAYRIPRSCNCVRFKC